MPFVNVYSVNVYLKNRNKTPWVHTLTKCAARAYNVRLQQVE
jgi:phenylpyruvate tautomerase PptA (4-oxalocrotonate tautomerase family)